MINLAKGASRTGRGKN